MYQSVGAGERRQRSRASDSQNARARGPLEKAVFHPHHFTNEETVAPRGGMDFPGPVMTGKAQSGIYLVHHGGLWRYGMPEFGLLSIDEIFGHFL